MPRLRGVLGFFWCFVFFPAREQGAAAKEAPQPFRNDEKGSGSSFLVCVCPSPPPPPPRSSPGQALSRTSDKPSAQNITRFRGGGRGGEEKKTPHCQAGFKTLPCGLCAPLWGCSSGSHGGPTAGPSAPSLRDASSPARPSRCQRCSRLPGFTLAPNHNLRVNSEETVTLLLANRH